MNDLVMPLTSRRLKSCGEGTANQQEVNSVVSTRRRREERAEDAERADFREEWEDYR